jgi:hypothetical protein
MQIDGLNFIRVSKKFGGKQAKMRKSKLTDKGVLESIIMHPLNFNQVVNRT